MESKKIPELKPGGGPNSDTEMVGWSPWKEGVCRSGCTMRSRGFRERRRQCASPDGCDGTGYDVVLCDDIKVFTRICILLL